jgi:hypothetical protein
MQPLIKGSRCTFSTDADRKAKDRNIRASDFQPSLIVLLEVRRPSTPSLSAEQGGVVGHRVDDVTAIYKAILKAPHHDHNLIGWVTAILQLLLGDSTALSFVLVVIGTSWLALTEDP